MSRVLLFNKPFDVLSQFTDSADRSTLRNFLPQPQCDGFYPAGRLDRDSEGLLILTDNGALQHRIAHPELKMLKIYWVQVEGEYQEIALENLREGVLLKDGPTVPAKVRLIDPPSVWPRIPPIRSRAHIPTHWLEISITEGRNRQVRRMTAAVGLPTLRLIRVQIGSWKLGDMQPGEYKFETVHLAQVRTLPTKRSHRDRRSKA